MNPVILFHWKTLTLAAFLIIPMNDDGRSQEMDRKKTSLDHSPLPSGLPSSTLININRFSAWYESNGIQETDPENGNAGVRYPHSASTAIFQSGLLWGGIFSDGSGTGIRVNGQEYVGGMKPGAILGTRTGISEDPDQPDVRLWRIRRDYQTADLQRDAAELNRVNVSDVTTDMIEAVRNQYAIDWLEWPWWKGAPFYDSNGNAVKEANEEPGIAGADQVIWFVCNDLDVESPWGQPSSGIEQQVTIWAFEQPSILHNIVFKRFLIAYKGKADTPENAIINDMYLTHWSDPDLGSPSDDFAGCDTLLDLGFVYNSKESDEWYGDFGLSPPSVGFDLLQGPIVRGDQFAENIPMTAFLYFAAGGTYSDPPHNSDGGVQWYQMMRGLPPQPNGPPDPPPPIDPFTGQLSGPFWLYDKSDGVSAPDPTYPSGWVDGMIELPGDRRIVMSTGPFQMFLGESQEIAVAMVGGSDSSITESIGSMKYESTKAQFVHDGAYLEMPPECSVSLEFPSESDAVLTIYGDSGPSDVVSMFVNVIDPEGELRATEPLYDDGTHGDETPGDGIFSTMLTVARNPSPHSLEVSCSYASGRSFLWKNALTGIATVGSFDIRNPMVFSDNYNADGIANPGENIRYGLTISYNGISSLHNVVLSPSPESEGAVRAYNECLRVFLDSMIYNPVDTGTFFSTDIPLAFSDSIFRISMELHDYLGNYWLDTIAFSVDSLLVEPRHAVLSHFSGMSSGEFRILVLDTLAVTDHIYVIDGVNESGFLGFTLRDSTDGRILLDNHPFPDEYGHNVPVTDGFRVMRGSILPDGGWDTTSLPSGNLVWTALTANGLRLEGFDGAMGAGWTSWFSGSSIPSYAARDVLIRFASTDIAGNLINPGDPLGSYAYRYLQNADHPPEDSTFIPYILNPDTGFAYQDFQRSMPFAAYDVSEAPPRRLALGHLENNSHWGRVNGNYWPPQNGFLYPGRNNTHETGPREWFFIFDSDYSETPEPQFQVDIEHVRLPLMWWGTPNRNGDIAFFQGDEFMILPDYPYLSSDAWIFNPTVTVVNVPPPDVPQTYALFQNFPNPFNPSTTIRFAIERTSRVSIRVYNILGQQVRTLVDDVREAGLHTINWDSKNDTGNRIATGVYFYRMTASDAKGGRGAFVALRKMLVIK